MDGDGLADAAAGGASVAGGGGPDGVVRAGGAECGERAGEAVGSRAGEAGECAQGVGGCGDEHVVLGAVVTVLIFVENQEGRTASTSVRVRWLAWASRVR